MSNEPEHWSVNLNRAMYWIHEETQRGQPVTRRRFLAEFSGSSFPTNYGKDLLAELSGWSKARRSPPLVIDRDGYLRITVAGRAWFAASTEPPEEWFAGEGSRWATP
jgi:hypothetical protein